MHPYAKKGYINGVLNKKAFQWTIKDIQWWEYNYGSSGIILRHLNRWHARRVNRKIYERYGVGF